MTGPKTETAPPALAARGLGRDLPGPLPVTLVNDIDLSLAAGDFAVVTGPSGSGKSSLLYLLGLLDAPTRGEVYIEGRPTAALDGDARARLRLERFGFVFQFHFLLPELSVLENVLLPMRKLGRLGTSAMRDRGMDLLGRLSMADQAEKRPDQLSGGQRQRAAIARALANDPAFILADEPTGALDSKNGRQVFDILHDLAGQGRTVLVVTHDEALAAAASHRIRMIDGRISEGRIVA